MRSAKNQGANLIAAEVRFDGSELVEVDVVAEGARVVDEDKARRLGLVHTCWGGAHLTQTAERRRASFRVHGVTCRSLETFLDGPASAA
jgi:hypothetical protein